QRCCPPRGACQTRMPHTGSVRRRVARFQPLPLPTRSTERSARAFALAGGVQGLACAAATVALSPYWLIPLARPCDCKLYGFATRHRELWQAPLAIPIAGAQPATRAGAESDQRSRKRGRS